MKETIPDWLRHIADHFDTIYVREQIDGRWESVSLASLPPAHALAHVIRFLEEGIRPVYVKREHLDSRAE